MGHAEFNRRIVTGVDEEGKSRIWLDGEVPEKAIFDSSKDGRMARVIWATDEVPSPIETSDPMVDWFPTHEWFSKTGVQIKMVFGGSPILNLFLCSSRLAHI